MGEAGLSDADPHLLPSPLGIQKLECSLYITGLQWGGDGGPGYTGPPKAMYVPVVLTQTHHQNTETLLVAPSPP